MESRELNWTEILRRADLPPETPITASIKDAALSFLDGVPFTFPAGRKLGKSTALRILAVIDGMPKDRLFVPEENWLMVQFLDGAHPQVDTFESHQAALDYAMKIAHEAPGAWSQLFVAEVVEQFDTD